MNNLLTLIIKEEFLELNNNIIRCSTSREVKEEWWNTAESNSKHQSQNGLHPPPCPSIFHKQGMVTRYQEYLIGWFHKSRVFACGWGSDSLLTVLAGNASKSMNAGVTASNIIRELPQEALNSPISDLHVAELASEMKNWEQYVPYLRPLSIYHYIFYASSDRS